MEGHDDLADQHVLGDLQGMREGKRDWVRRVAAWSGKGRGQRREGNPCGTMAVMVGMAVMAGHAALTGDAVMVVIDFDLLVLLVLLGSRIKRPTHTMKTEKLNSLGTERDEMVTDFF